MPHYPDMAFEWKKNRYSATPVHGERSGAPAVSEMRTLGIVAGLLLLAGLHYASAIEDAEISQKFYQEFKKYRETKHITPEFQDILHEFSFQGADIRAGTVQRLGMCSVCNAVVRTILTFKQGGTPEEDIIDMLEDLCVLLKIESESVCAGVIETNADIFMYIMDNNPNLPAERVCGLLLQDGQQTCNPKYAIEWTLEVPLGEKPQPAVKEIPENGESYTVVQISDIHYDPRYTIGGNANCGEPTCCRQDQGSPASPSDAAGYWGDYRSCDMPWHAVVDALEQIEKEHQNIDFVYFTGDLVDHGVWETSRDLNNGIFNQFYAEYQKKFPNTPLFPTLGNHEPHPLNVWLLDDHGTDLLRDQLNWLTEVLLQAEKANEKVHILAHIPPGVSDSLNSCSREFRRIIDRFENTVVAQFNGHTHNDEFHIFYSLENPERATNVALNGGSATTYTYLNPNYKVYKIDKTTGLVIDSETWTYNLTDANLNGNAVPKWYKLYSFQEEYGVKSLVPSELDDLAHRMAKTPALLEKYHRFYVKDSDARQGCDSGCRQRHLCQIVTDHAPDTSHCSTIYQ
ncbi:Uncharacterized protein GBIM_16515 [Gryllus bimaculatus]|nr:Uncharacterized protein GBIM_16515 [Gryllus bimaculatus]